jgi:peptide/nickel transport system permease protein
MIDAIAARDFPMVQGSVLLVATLFVLVNLVVDIVYTYVDPRIKFQ